MRIARRLFVVPLADNNHGKTSMIRALVSQGVGYAYRAPQPGKGARLLTSPWGREIDAFVFGRSYQEVEKDDYDGVEEALDENDPEWRKRELIIMPSHVNGIENDNALDDIDQMIDLAHSAGFDTVCATVIFTDPDEERLQFADIWRKSWDERWTIPNPTVGEHDRRRLEGQLSALGRDLWTWICRELAS